MILSARHLLNKNPDPTTDEVREALSAISAAAPAMRKLSRPSPKPLAARSDPADYDLIAPGKLQAVVQLLADEPGKWLPIAGGTV